MAKTNKNQNSSQQDQVPSIRIVPYIEGPRSLHFDIIERDIPEGTVIKIGRFTDKAHVPNRVTFKSKVVSRGHAEIWCEGGEFFIKDTKSSSGTFLNHLRLSSPSQESKPSPLKDGDLIQLGVDYQGGTEEIYRCVKMRIELNRSWQRQVNNFNLNALKQLKQLTGPGAFKHQTTDCCICLCGIGPCQALFLAPCSHVFHYKCVRPILVNHHTGFLCPMCRSYADLEASTENAVDWEAIIAEQEEAVKKEGGDSTKQNQNINQSAKGDQTVIMEQIDIATSDDITGTATTRTLNTLEAPSNVNSNNTISSQLNSIQINGHSLSNLTLEEFKILYNAIHHHPLLASSSPASSTIPIPGSKPKKSSTEENDTMMLSRTLRSSPPSMQGLSYFDENIESGPSSPPNPQHSESSRLGEIVEDEGSMSSSSSNPSGKRYRESHPNLSASSVQDMSSSSASASDNDDDVPRVNNCNNFNFITTEDGIENGFVEVTTLNNPTDTRMKGKGVVRLGLNRKENVL